MGNSEGEDARGTTAPVTACSMAAWMVATRTTSDRGVEVPRSLDAEH
jgi:hypothetical protein